MSDWESSLHVGSKLICCGERVECQYCAKFGLKELFSQFETNEPSSTLKIEMKPFPHFTCESTAFHRWISRRAFAEFLWLWSLCEVFLPSSWIIGVRTDWSCVNTPQGLCERTVVFGLARWIILLLPCRILPFLIDRSRVNAPHGMCEEAFQLGLPWLIYLLLSW